MEVSYETNKIERLCTDERWMKRQREDVAKKLVLRHNALVMADSVGHLVDLDPLGRWHGLSENLAGYWSGRLSGNWRIIVRPTGEELLTACTAVTVIDLDDYH